MGSLRDYPRIGQSLHEYAADTAFDLFEEKLDAIIENSDKPKDKRTNEEIIKDALQEFKPSKRRFY
jgi:hypothetical protein